MPDNANHVSREEFEQLVGEVKALKESVAENTECTRRTEANTQGLVELFDALSGGFKVIAWLGRAAKPIGYIAGALAAVIGLWTAIKGGGLK
ncbi:hypothetical protein [Cupriavidus alkaliphilus]|uniref:hypothetical protein n=1 Tax=Cupriavidus alkaliphilus TaxID=942866 RepID=UPI0016127856|nr:hypothetical protein [Cupriavidus alkaliphilus]MBB2918188.1 hypothetical protein [Cupriavidus alkaliphilus]